MYGLSLLLQKLRNVFPCELENRYVEPEDFLESLLKREPWAVGGVERRKRTKRHDRLTDYLAANPNSLEPGLTFRGAEIPVSSTSGEGGSIDLLFVDRAERFRPIENRVNIHAALVSINQRLGDRHRCELVRLEQDLMARVVEVLNDCRQRIAAARKSGREANLELGLGGANAG